MAPASIRTSPASRTAYLARAVIWLEPGPLSPDNLLRGPTDELSNTLAPAISGDAVACTFAQPGHAIGGATLKFLCRTADGQVLRLKYWRSEERRVGRECRAGETRYDG